MGQSSRFSLLTVIEAASLLTYRSHAELNKLMLRLSVEEHVPQTLEISKDNKVNKLVLFAKQHPGHRTLSDKNLADEIVEHAVDIVAEARDLSWASRLRECTAFLNALARDGFTLTEDNVLRSTLPSEADLPQTDDELHALLDEFSMATEKGHLDQAISNHTQGHWASANAQLRTFMESLFDAIAYGLEPVEADKTVTSENRRQLLASGNSQFLNTSLGEWGNDGKNFINGLFKRLHPEGSHPGLSDEEDCTFRLHLVLIVARYFLRRMQDYLQTQEK